MNLVEATDDELLEHFKGISRQRVSQVLLKYKAKGDTATTAKILRARNRLKKQPTFEYENKTDEEILAYIVLSSPSKVYSSLNRCEKSVAARVKDLMRKTYLLSLAAIRGQKPKTRSPEYRMWYSMLHRCGYVGDTPNKNYTGCEIDSRFLKLEDFLAWARKQQGFLQKDFELDKDLFCHGNKIYSPETCVFLPRKINIALIKRSIKSNGLPCGVYKDNKKFKAYTGQEYVGTYASLSEASEAYKQAKKKHIISMAEEYKEQIDARAYNALLNYTV